VRKLLIVAIVALACMAPAAAAWMDWVENNDEKRALAQLATGYAWGQICNRNVDTEVATRFLNEKLGVTHWYGAAQVADMMFMVNAMIAFERQIVGVSPAVCNDARKAFGPHGSAIPGLID